MTVLYWIIAFYAFLLILCNFLPFIPAKHWWVRIWETPRVQILVQSAVAAAVLLLLDQHTWTVVLVALLLTGITYQFYRIYPYTPLASKELPDLGNPYSYQDALSLLVCNVLMTNRNYNRLLTLIREKEPDAILLLEPDTHWLQELEPVLEDYIHRALEPLDNLYGLAFYCKLPVRDMEIQYRITDDTPSVRAKIQVPSGKWINFFGIHPRPPVPRESDTWERDIELIQVASEVKNKPTIVAGDLNDVAWSDINEKFQKISHMLDPRKGRGLYNSYHAKWPGFRFPLDHVFVSTHFKLISLQKCRPVGSDHYPMLLSVQLTD